MPRRPPDQRAPIDSELRGRYIQTDGRFVLGRPRDLAFVGLTLSKVLQVPSWWPMMARYSQEMTAFYRRLLERAAAAGEIDGANTEARATALLGAVDGLAAYVLMDDSLTPDTAAEHLGLAFLGKAGLGKIAGGATVPRTAGPSRKEPR